MKTVFPKHFLCKIISSEAVFQCRKIQFPLESLTNRNRKHLSERFKCVIYGDISGIIHRCIFFFIFLASEIQHFLLYYGLPLLKPFLHNEIFHHLALLTTAMWLLVKREVTLEDVNMAKDLLDSFSRLIKSFYGMYSW